MIYKCKKNNLGISQKNMSDIPRYPQNIYAGY